MALRNRIAIGVLIAGALLDLLLWRVGAHWLAPVIAVLAVLVAAAAYRVRSPHLPLGPADAAEPDRERIDQ